ESHLCAAPARAEKRNGSHKGASAPFKICAARVRSPGDLRRRGAHRCMTSSATPRWSASRSGSTVLPTAIAHVAVMSAPSVRAEGRTPASWSAVTAVSIVAGCRSQPHTGSRRWWRASARRPRRSSFVNKRRRRLQSPKPDPELVHQLQHVKEPIVMKASDAFPSRYLQTSVVKGKPIVAVISHVEMETVGQGADQKRKPVLYLD